MAELQPLVDALHRHGSSSSPSSAFSSPQCVSDPYLQQALRHLTALLVNVPRHLQDLQRQSSSGEKQEEKAENEIGDGERVESDTLAGNSFNSWSSSQLDSVLHLAEASIFHLRHVPLERGLTEPLEGLFCSTIDTCINALKILNLEKVGRNLNSWNEQVQNKILHLMELAVDEGKAIGETSFVNLSADDMQGLKLCDPVDSSFQGFMRSSPLDTSDGIEETEVSENIMQLLDSDQPINFAMPEMEKSPPEFSNMLSASQYYAITHSGIHKELLGVCGSLIAKFDFIHSEDGQNQLRVRLSLVSRMLRLLCFLAKFATYFPCSEDMANSLIGLAAWIPQLLMQEVPMNMEDVNNNYCCYATFISSVVALAEAIGFGHCVTQNLRVFVSASAIDILVSNRAKNCTGFSCQKLPAVLEPQVLSYICGLIRGIHAHSWQGNSIDHARKRGKVWVFSQAPILTVKSQKFSLTAERNQDSMMQIIFPEGQTWLSELLNAVSQLYSIGMETSPGGEKPSPHRRESEHGICLEVPGISSEDEALFGNLFSESSKQPSSSDSISQSNAENRASVFHDTALQAVIDVLILLKDCVFCLGCQMNISKGIQRHVNAEGMDLLLEIYLRSSIEKIDVQCSTDTLLQLSKVSFDLMNFISMKADLPFELEKHFLYRILEKGYIGCSMPSKTSAILCKLLIHHSSRKDVQELDGLTLAIWRSFKERIVNILHNTDWLDLSVVESAASLPSIYFIEVLLMSFHSAGLQTRLSIIQSVKSLLKDLSKHSQKLVVPGLASHSLLFSKVVMIFNYLLVHFKSFPSWLITDLKANMSHALAEDSSHGQAVGFSPVSMAAIVSQSLRDAGPVSQQTCMADAFLVQLHDIGAFCKGSVNVDTDVFASTDALADIGILILDFLDTWRGKSVNKVEELLVERHAFFLGWTTFFIISKQVPQIREIRWDSSAADLMMQLTQIFFSYAHIEKDVLPFGDFDIFLNSILGCSEALKRTSELALIDRLRRFSVLNLLLSTFQKGFEVSNMDTSEETRNEESALFSKHLVCGYLNYGSMGTLLKNLSALLSSTIESFHYSLVDVLIDNQMSELSLSVLLVLKGGLSWVKQDQLFTKLGVSFSPLHNLLRRGMPLSWNMDILSKYGSVKKFSSAEKFFQPSLLYGHPCSYNPASAMVMSCICLIHSLLGTLRSILKSSKELDSYDGEIIDILEVLMLINCEEIFESVQTICQEVICLLVPSSDRRLQVSYLHLIRQKESLLKAMTCSTEINDSIREELILHVVEVFNGIYTDPIRCGVFKQYFASGGGCLSIFMDVLDGCYQETVNLKVLQFLTNVIGAETTSHSSLLSTLQEKILKIDSKDLSSWLEQRLLGSSSRTGDSSSSFGLSSSNVRDVLVDFLNSLVCAEFVLDGKDLHSHLLNALLLILEQTINSLDSGGRRAYFCLLQQLANKEPHIRHVLLSIIQLMGKLPGQNCQMEGLKALLSFVLSLLNSFGGQHGNFINKPMEGGGSRPTGLPNSTTKSKASLPKKSSEVTPTMIEQTGQANDCDTISVDEDEDDGTSDGEITSLDKDEEDDGSHNEKTLASGVCTFTSSGNNFMEQHWYFCYTCDLTVSKGCCSVCAKVCHCGHKVVYSRLSRFFCDCGAGGVRGQSCLCLKPQKYVSTAPVSTSADPEPLSSDSDSELEDDTWIDSEKLCKISTDENEEVQLLSVFSDLDVEKHVLLLCERLNSFNWISRCMPSIQDVICLGEDKTLTSKGDFLCLKRFYKSSSFDMKMKAEYVSTKELKCHLANGTIVKSVLSTNGRNKLAVGEGDKVTIFDVEQVVGPLSTTPVTVDKTTVKPLSKNSVRFELVHLVFNPANESYLAVAGFEDCQIFTVNSRGEVSDRLAVELALHEAHICRILWVPGSQVQLMVVTNMFVKIYDLSQDNISPVHYCTVFEDQIVDAALIPISQGHFMLVVLSHSGVLYRHFLAPGAEPGAQVLTENIVIPEIYQVNKGVSLHYSSALRLLLLSFLDGLTLIARLVPKATDILEISAIYENDTEGKRNPAGLHHWTQLDDDGRGLFIALSNQKTNTAAAILFGASELEAQYLRASNNLACPRIDGVTSYRFPLKDKHDLLILHEDGSLQVFAIGEGSESLGNSTKSSALEVEQIKKLGDAILDSKASNPPAPVFPLDFFEKATWITNEIKLGGDGLRNLDPEVAKSNLASDDGFIEGPTPSGFKITIYNPNPDTVMVGCRVHVGNSSTSHIPSELRIFRRAVKLEEGVRCWYDIPFTNAEALLADEEFTLTVGPTFGGFSLPRIDNLEVYGRSKEDFGWKEKLQAVLDLESQASVSCSMGRSKSKPLKSASLEEQVVGDCFRLLCSYYLAVGTKPGASGASIEISRRRCKPLLELVFESDRQPYLQAAARRVLHTLYPTKDAFYQAKDTLRLTGVSRVCSLLASRVGLSGSALSSVIQEFTAQLRAVCKIALHRRSNFASFLESYGSAVVEDLMKVLWELLTVEQPDAEKVNNLIVPSVDLIYGYAECLALRCNNGLGTSVSVAPAVTLFKKLLFAPHETVRASCSLAMSSRLLQVPFPKQTILANDDVGENPRPSLPSESGPGTGSDGQVMMEEDGGNASVQYCCDGCSTVPIVGRRWHCTVCPDFDLCEACYEIMDGDRLAPPHSRDHPMSAIPIDIDNVANGEVGDISFASIEDLSEENLLQVATALSMRNTATAGGSSLDVADNRTDNLTTVIEPKGIAISASKRALNSLLLKSLIDESRGWIKQTSGSQALPLMQFFYRLASASTSPFIEGSGTESINLEVFVRLLLEELNLSEPLSIKARTNFGEVLVLVFTFFNLMLRNWHQSGSDNSLPKSTTRSNEVSQIMQSSSGTGSPSSDEGHVKTESGSQLDKACAVLRQQQLMNYLLLLIQQLGQIFKSSSRNIETGPQGLSGSMCGALLTVRKEFAAGNFSPFFTDSYVKAHRNDLFKEYHRLLLESTFRLAYNMVRPEKTSDKDQVSGKVQGAIDLKLDGWQEVLCSFINNPHTTSIRRFARRLLLHVCGSKSHYYNVRDAWQFSREVRKLFKLVQKAGGFQSLQVYERSVKLVKCLSTVVEVAAARPKNWQKYCSRHPDILQFLLTGIFAFGEESVIQTLKLLMLAFYAGKESGVSSSSKGEISDSVNVSADNGMKQANDARKKKRGSSEDALDIGSEKAFVDMEFSAEQFMADSGDLLIHFIDAFLLEWNASSVRAETKAVLMGVWHHGKVPVREMLLKKMLDKIPVLPSYGQNIAEYADLLTWILGKGIQGSGSGSQEYAVVQSCLTNNMVKLFFDTLCSQNELLANHPNSRIYSTLSSLVDFDGYYLESEPCLACSCPEVSCTRMKLDSLKSETKFTDNRILVKCTGSYTIQSVTMNVHDARRSKSVKVLNLYYNNRPVTDLSELKNNWSLWKRAKSCYLAFNQTELKIEFAIPITACNLMIELDSFYENLQASSLESLQCPRCSRYVTDKHGICGNCHENAYQCRQCRNINYENLDSFLCNECGYSKYGRFEFNFMAKPSFHFESMESDEDMKKGLAAIEVESENAHKRYQQLLSFKKPLLKLVSSIGETETDSQQKDSVQQMIVSLPGPSSIKINRKIAILGVLYGEKCKMAFDSVSRSVQNLQGLRRVLSAYLEQKRSSTALNILSSNLAPKRPANHCYGCANTFVGHCLEWLQMLAKMPQCRQQLVSAGILSELFENNIHQGSKMARVQARSVLCAFTEGDLAAVGQLNNLIKQKAVYCLDHHRSIDIAACVRDELSLLSETCALTDEFWESRLRIVFQLLFTSIQVGAKHPVISEHIILPCLRIILQACTPPKTEASTTEAENSSSSQSSEARSDSNEHVSSNMQQTRTPPASKSQGSSLEKDSEQGLRGDDMTLVSYAEWKNGAAYVDFVRRQYVVSQGSHPTVPKTRRDSKRTEFLALKYFLRWKRKTCKVSLKNEFSAFEESSWVSELALSACSQAIRVEMCRLIEILCSQSPSRKLKFLNLLMALLPAARTAGESACDYFELFYKLIEAEDARLFLTVRGFLQTLCKLITEEVNIIEAQEHSFHVDISQGYILHKFIELLGKFLRVPNIRVWFMRDGLLSQVLEALLIVRGLVVQKTKLISDCSRLLRDLLDGLLQESFDNKRYFIQACTAGLQTHVKLKNDRTLAYILELLCNIICPMKPEPAYMMVLNKAHTQEEFIRGSMTKNPYSSLEVGPLMRDVKNKICHQLDLLGLIEDDYGMELLVAGHIISLDLSVAQVYEQVWKKAQNQSSGSGTGSSVGSSGTTGRECPPMTVTYRLQGLDGEATEPMIKELEDDREETQDPEVEFAISGVMRECGGLEVVLNMVQDLSDDDIRSSREELTLLLKLLMYCCKIRDNRLALLALGALGVLIDTAKRAFSVEATESAESLLLIVECLVTEANESDIGIAKNSLSVSRSPDGKSTQARYVVQMFLERLSHSHGAKKSSKQQRNNDMVARILPYLTYGEQEAMGLLIEHFDPYLHDWSGFDHLMKSCIENPSDVVLSQEATQHQLALENFCKVTESIKHDAQGGKLKGIIMQKGIVTECIQHLKSVFAVFGTGGDHKATAEWAQGLELPSIPIILQILKGLSSGHSVTQDCLNRGGILPLLHALEGVSGENEIGVRAENLMDTLADKENKGEGFLTEEVIKLRNATRDEMRKRALQEREKLLQGLGMRREVTSGGERIVISQSIEGLDDVQEEEAGLACMVCREGYSLCPEDMLGTYCYSKRVNLGIGSSHNTRAEWVYTTVSHFNVIHFQCHLEAKKADASLKNPKKEWEGAALRNNETLCNNLFPLRGPSVPLAQYARYGDQYWDNLNALGRADGSRLRLLIYDIVLMLARFATGASFSADCKGGGKESNSRLLPFMLQMACHLLDQGGVSQKRLQSKALSTYLSTPVVQEIPVSASKPSAGSSPQRFGAVDETVQFMMVQSLLLESLGDWQQHRRLFLQRGVYHAYMQFKHGHASLAASPISSTASVSRSSSSSSSSEVSSSSTHTKTVGDDLQVGSLSKEQLFTVVQPMLIYIGLIDQLQQFLKSGPMRTQPETSGQDEQSKAEVGSAHLEAWELVMKERLRDIKAMLGFSNKLLEWLDEMQSAVDLQEAFDIMGALADALASHSSCEDFIRDAINFNSP